jgi:alpha-D-xyloside xylohydrolase
MADGYTRGYHAMYREALGENAGFLLARHAQWGEQATPGLIIWPGDIDATLTRWKERFTDRGGEEHVGVGGLPSAIRAGVGLAVSGFPLFAADTGGYRESPPNKETFMRWVEQSALMPVMQTGDSSSQPPWVFTPQNGRDAEALDTYRRYARLHLRLFPFFWTLMSDANALPVVRAFGLQFPELNQHPEDQYLLGDSLLVAPVETAGATSRTVVLPPGNWFDFDTGAQLTTTNVDAPLTKLPLFIREGALVAMLAPDVDTLAPATDADVHSFANAAGTLWVRAQPGDGAVTLFDGTALSQTSTQLRASAGTRFTSSVVWELIGAPVGTVTHGGSALAVVTDLDAVTSGVLVDGPRTLIKTPLDGQATVWR